MPFQSERQAHGGIVVDGVHVGDSLMCPHCGSHFISVRGSGVVRGWCPRCSAVTCGQGPCMICIPVEARMDHIEGRKTAYDDAIRELGPGVIL